MMLDEKALRRLIDKDSIAEVVSTRYAVGRRLRAGTVGHNRFETDLAVAFGGFKQSGLGREGGIEGLHPYLETKTMIFETAPISAQNGSST